MTARVIVHAGFHKTGTSSLQDYLRENRARLRPWFDFHGPGDALHRSAVAGRLYATAPFPWRLAAFRRALRADLAALPDAEVIVLSREHYAGQMPGHRRWNRRPIRDFASAGIPLARAMVAELRRRFGPGVEIVFLYTTRQPDSWFASVHGHLLRSVRLTDDLATFRAGFAPDLRLDAEAARIAQAIAPVPVETAWLEEVATRREGPAAALLDLLDLPEEARAALPPARRANVGNSAEARARFLDLNRRIGDDATLRRMKRESAGAKAPIPPES